MKLRDGNIIVCDCGAELNPEITTAQDFIKYADGVATCSNCGETGAISFPVPPVVVAPPSLEDRVVTLEGTTTEIVSALNDKGLIP